MSALADPLWFEGGVVALRIEHFDLGPPTVDHVHNIVDRHRALRNVRGNHNLSKNHICRVSTVPYILIVRVPGTYSFSTFAFATFFRQIRKVPTVGTVPTLPF